MDPEIIINSREYEVPNYPAKNVDEGGCGVVGCASSKPVKGRHFLPALEQMKNRGNGKGGGVAMLGLEPKQWGITEEILEKCYIYQIAYLDETVRDSVQEEFINSNFDILHQQEIETLQDYNAIGLEVRPPKVVQYYVRVNSQILDDFINKYRYTNKIKAEEEFIYQNTFKLNNKFYASLGEKQAFVLSHGKNLLVFKIVGYGDQVLKYYKLVDKVAHIWVGHHRYPTKGTVWHPGGAHPFIGLNEALVHNGDFSNYQAVSDYLAQRKIYPQFLTDTEVAALQFDLYSRVFEYPTEYIIEAMAPTTERDFWMLPSQKREIYNKIQLNHLHGSPDGPWFFIIGRSILESNKIQLLGITDTSMLRPQVFALFENSSVSIGLIASERQAIDATLRSISKEDPNFANKADIYWNARGGSHTDGGAFLFDVILEETPKMVCKDKFGNQIKTPRSSDQNPITKLQKKLDPFYGDFLTDLKSWDDLTPFIEKAITEKDPSLDELVKFLTKILDNWHLLPNSKNGRSRSIVEDSLNKVFRSYPPITQKGSVGVLLNYENLDLLRPPIQEEKYLVMDVSDFPVEGDNSAANTIVDAYNLGWKHVFSFDWRGHRFCGVGLGSNSSGFRIDVYGNPGDYLASGLDGAEIVVHTSAQDQVGQMMKSGKLVIYGDVGQTFLYGAKGGDIFVLGNAAGRPLINAVGKPRVIINGTCLDYLAESFMAGDPLNDGGFVILNGLSYSNEGSIIEKETPYPGGNLFSLASGGAIYVNDPERKLEQNQLNGGKIQALSLQDWDVILPYLQMNKELFQIDLISKENTNGKNKLEDYIKIQPVKIKELSEH